MRICPWLAAAASALALNAASAADLPSRKAPPPAPAMMEPASAFTWTGFYAGLNAGGLINDSSLNASQFSGKETGASAIGGVTIGYNWQIRDTIVVGVEGDVDYRSRLAVSTPATRITSAKEGYLGTARGRIGYAFGRALLYGTGGVAFANAIAPDTLAVPAYGYSGVRGGANGGTQIGWTAGLGLEYAISESLSFKGEYLYAGLGQKTLQYVAPGTSLATGLVPTKMGAHVLRAGLNYRFGTENPFWFGRP
ncbi:MAG: porin family protein [Hyphomicrobiales bacterium]|nr:porin family protein [Hyphomicrobiales bacterium]